MSERDWRTCDGQIVSTMVAGWEWERGERFVVHEVTVDPPALFVIPEAIRVVNGIGENEND